MRPARSVVTFIYLLMLFVPARAHVRELEFLTFVRTAVEDANGRSVRGLTSDDFEILSDGVACQVHSAKTGEALTLILVIDISSSIWSAVRPLHDPLLRGDIGKGSLEASLGVLRSIDRTRIGSFSGRAIMSPAFRSDLTMLTSDLRAAYRVPEADRFGPSAIWDAIDGAVALLTGEPGRLAVIVMTDGRSAGNRRSELEVTQHAQRIGAAVSVIGEGPVWIHRELGDAETAVLIDPSVSMRRIAAATGGTYVADDPAKRTTQEFLRGATRAAVPGDLFKQLVVDLQHEYMVGFTPRARDGQLHRLEVRVKRPGLKARAPAAYRAG